MRYWDASALRPLIVAVDDRPAGHEFVCLDTRLAEAAAREGYRRSAI